MRLDLLHLARSLRRSPVSAAAAILTLALTIGVSTAIFAVVHAALLPPPFRDPDALALVGERPPDDAGAPLRSVSYETFEAWREAAGPLAVLEGFDGTNLTLTGIGHPERVSATDVTPGFLRLLGVEVARGRGFAPEDVARPVAIVSHGFWQAKLGGDAAVVGRTLVLGARAHTIIGVLPDGFRFELDRGDIWRPIPLDAVQARRAGYRVRALARLAPGVASGGLRDALDRVSRSATPPARAGTVRIADAISANASGPLRLLAGAAAVALMVAFVNLAGLLIVRTIDRRRELAVRRALGSAPAGLVRQMLVESHALVGIGTLAGAMLAAWLTPAVAALALPELGAVADRDVPVAWPIVAIIALASLTCAWACGLAPAAVIRGGNDADVLRRGVTPARRALRWRRALVGGQVAVAFVLLMTGTLLGRSLLALLSADPGFDPAAVSAMQVSLPGARYPSDERVASLYESLQGALQERLRSPVAIVDEMPLTGDRGRVLVRSQPRSDAVEAVLRAASRGYFETLSIPLIDGRTFGSGDTAAAPRRVVLSAAAAARLFGTERAVGRRVVLARVADPAEVVGVVGDVAHRALDEPRLPTVYVSALQTPSPGSVIVVRSPRPLDDVARAVREEVARLDGDLPVYGVRTIDEVVAGSPGIAQRRILVAAFAGFAGLAIALCAIGLFGVAAHDVAARRGELALRIALGAGGANVLRTVIGQGLRPIAAGLLAGAAMSLWSRQVLGAAGFPLGSDTVSAMFTAALIFVVGTLAVLPAAVRAARTDPRAALAGD
jgi:predicted permease